MARSLLGIYSAAGAASAGGSFELISSTILTSTAASVDLTGLGTYSADYKHFQIRYTAKSSLATTAAKDITVTFNNVATANYARHRLTGDGTSVTATNALLASNIRMTESLAISTTASVFSAGVIDLLDVYSTSKNKTLRAFYGSTDTASTISFTSGHLNDLTAISSIQLATATGSFAVGSRFSIYGIRG